MHKSSVRALGLLPLASFVTAALKAQAAPDLSPSAIAARATPATVTIVTFTATGDTLGQGSGFLVQATGVVVTNWHVISGAVAAAVILANGERYTRVLYLDGDSTRDVVLLQIPGAGLPVLSVRSDVPPPGSRVVVIGSPLGLARTVADGMVSATRVVRGEELVQVSAPISRGSSGGPVLDSRGRVFAIASAFLAEGQQLNFAVPVRYAMGLLALRPTPQPLATSPAGLAQSATSRRTSPSPAPAANIWAPARAASPRSTLGGAYAAFRWVQNTSADGTKQAAVTAQDFIVVTDSGYGWTGFSCDSLFICKSATHVTARTAHSGDAVLNLGFTALDGYQADSGFIVHGQFSPATGGNTTVWIRAWRFVPPLSHRGGLYACSLQTQYLSGNFQGAFLDWTGEAAGIETADSIYVQIDLANSGGGTTGGRFVAVRGQTDDFSSAASYKEQDVSLSGTWSFGRLYGHWEDRREKGRFVGPLSCDRQ